MTLSNTLTILGTDLSMTIGRAMRILTMQAVPDIRLVSVVVRASFARRRASGAIRRSEAAMEAANMLAVVAMVVLHCSPGLAVRPTTSFVAKHADQVASTTDKVNCTRRFGSLDIALLALFFLPNAVFLKEELVAHVKIRIVANGSPSAHAVTCDTDGEHAVLSSAPLACI